MHGSVYVRSSFGAQAWSQARNPDPHVGAWRPFEASTHAGGAAAPCGGGCVAAIHGKCDDTVVSVVPVHAANCGQPPFDSAPVAHFITTFLAFEQFFSERSNSQRRTNVHCTGQLRTIGHWQQLICNWMNRASGRSDYGG